MDVIVITKILSLIAKKAKVWFDIDGTLVSDHKLTELGTWIKDKGLVIDVLTFGPWNVAELAKLGITAKTVVVFGDALNNGMAQYTDDGISKALPNDEWLVDNEAHPLTKNVIRV